MDYKIPDKFQQLDDHNYMAEIVNGLQSNNHTHRIYSYNQLLRSLNANDSPHITSQNGVFLPGVPTKMNKELNLKDLDYQQIITILCLAACPTNKLRDPLLAQQDDSLFKVHATVESNIPTNYKDIEYQSPCTFICRRLRNSVQRTDPEAIGENVELIKLVNALLSPKILDIHDRITLRNEFVGARLTDALTLFKILHSDNKILMRQIALFEQQMENDDQYITNTLCDIDLNSHHELLNAILHQIKNSPQEFELLTILRYLLSILLSEDQWKNVKNDSNANLAPPINTGNLETYNKSNNCDNKTSPWAQMIWNYIVKYIISINNISNETDAQKFHTKMIQDSTGNSRECNKSMFDHNDSKTQYDISTPNIIPTQDPRGSCLCHLTCPLHSNTKISHSLAKDIANLPVTNISPSSVASVTNVHKIPIAPPIPPPMPTKSLKLYCDNLSNSKANEGNTTKNIANEIKHICKNKDLSLNSDDSSYGSEEQNYAAVKLKRTSTNKLVLSPEPRKSEKIPLSHSYGDQDHIQGLSHKVDQNTNSPIIYTYGSTGVDSDIYCSTSISSLEYGSSGYDGLLTPNSLDDNHERMENIGNHENSTQTRHFNCNISDVVSQHYQRRQNLNSTDSKAPTNILKLKHSSDTKVKGSSKTFLPQQITPQPKIRLKTLNWIRIPIGKILDAKNNDNVWTSTLTQTNPSSLQVLFGGKKEKEIQQAIDFAKLEELFGIVQITSPVKNGQNNNTASIMKTPNASDDYKYTPCNSLGKDRISDDGSNISLNGSILGMGCWSEGGRRTQQEVLLLEPKRNLNISIYLKQFKSGYDELLQFIMDGKATSTMGTEKLRGLLKLMPESYEIDLIRSYEGQFNKLGIAEQFLTKLIAIPDYQLRIEGLLLKEDFLNILDEILPALDSIIYTAQDIKKCTTLHEILLLTVYIGNFINSGGYAGNAAGIKLSSLLKIVEIRGNHPKIGLIHIVAEQLTKVQISPAKLFEQLKYLEKAQKINMESLIGDITSLTTKCGNLSSQVNKTKDTILRNGLEDFLKYSKQEMDSIQRDLVEIERWRLTLSDFFCEDQSTFKLEECYKIFYTFIDRLKQADEENMRRKIHENEKGNNRYSISSHNNIVARSLSASCDAINADEGPLTSKNKLNDVSSSHQYARSRRSHGPKIQEQLMTFDSCIVMAPINKYHSITQRGGSNHTTYHFKDVSSPNNNETETGDKLSAMRSSKCNTKIEKIIHENILPTNKSAINMNKSRTNKLQKVINGSSSDDEKSSGAGESIISGLMGKNGTHLDQDSDSLRSGSSGQHYGTNNDQYNSSPSYATQSKDVGTDFYLAKNHDLINRKWYQESCTNTHPYKGDDKNISNRINISTNNMLAKPMNDYTHNLYNSQRDSGYIEQHDIEENNRNEEVNFTMVVTNNSQPATKCITSKKSCDNEAQSIKNHKYLTKSTHYNLKPYDGKRFEKVTTSNKPISLMENVNHEDFYKQILSKKEGREKSNNTNQDYNTFTNPQGNNGIKNAIAHRSMLNAHDKYKSAKCSKESISSKKSGGVMSYSAEDHKSSVALKRLSNKCGGNTQHASFQYLNVKKSDTNFESHKKHNYSKNSSPVETSNKQHEAPNHTNINNKYIDLVTNNVYNDMRTNENKSFNRPVNVTQKGKSETVKRDKSVPKYTLSSGMNRAARLRAQNCSQQLTQAGSLASSSQININNDTCTSSPQNNDQLINSKFSKNGGSYTRKSESYALIASQGLKTNKSQHHVNSKENINGRRSLAPPLKTMCVK